jgi:C-methyltransferase C-terminal domain/Putative zinc binding domain/Methyltransferase domain
MTRCRFCKHPLEVEMINMVNAPASNSFLRLDQLNEKESFYPLKVLVCEKCFLVQIDEYKAAGEIFDSNYAYFSSYSRSWLAHCENYVNQVIKRFNLTSSSKVVELASNDGYLLQFFKERNIPQLGVEPTRGTAEVAQAKGIKTIVRFFGEDCAKDIVRDEGKADLIAANNVLGHVPNINDFAKGIKTLLSEKGVMTAEFPHLLQLMKFNQFDTIYHEHFSYFSLTAIFKIFKENGLRIFDVEEIPTHGGSLRIYADHGNAHAAVKSVESLLEREKSLGMTSLDYYKSFQEVANSIKYQFLSFLIEARVSKKKVVAYGAAAKGNTLLNYCGVKQDLIDFVVDASPHKQGKFLPASHIPVVSEKSIRETKPEYVIILPWNLKSEITEQLAYIKEWGGKFVIAIPELTIF